MTGPARLAIGAAAAALVASALGAAAVALPIALCLASVLAGVGVLTPRRRLLPVALGALLVCARLVMSGPPATPPPPPTGDGPWLAVVESVGSLRGAARPAVIVLDQPPGVRLAATLPWYPEVEPGDHIRVDGTPEPPPVGDPYAAYLARLGASGSIRARSLALVEGGAGSGGPTWEALRAAAADGLERALPEPEGGLAAGILVGLRDRVDRDLAAAFTTAGVSHIVAISGWNIAIVATTLGALTGRLGRRRRTIATGLAIAAYVAFVGPSPSVVRAGAMAGCALVARELGRPTGAMSAMGLAVAGLLVLDPGDVTDPGFQLSVLATAGLISWGSGLTRRIAGPTPGRLRAWLAESLGVSLAAQAATLPVILLDFGRLSLVSPAVNVLVAPLVAPAMAAGGLALLGGLLVAAGAPAGLATLAGLPAWALLGLLVAVVRLGAGLPFASVTLDPSTSGVAAAASAGIVLLVVRGLGPILRLTAWARRAGRRPAEARLARGQQAAAARRAVADGQATRTRRTDRTRRAMALAVGAATLAVGVAVAHRPDGATRVTVLDVGQGDAILVEGGAGSRLLVDGGPDPGRLLIALDERLPPWDRRIDDVVLTHPHEDHVSGLAQLLSRYRVARVFEPGMAGSGPGYAAWEAALANNGPTRWLLGTGDRLTIDAVSFRVLWPDPGTVPTRTAETGTEINNVSIVLLGQVSGHRFLLTGDIEQGVDPQLLTRGLPSIELLKVAHHGSGTASTGAFLEATRPSLAVVSVGAGNPYGHPAATTMSRLQQVIPRVLRTDLLGSVTVTFGASGTQVRTSRTADLSGPPANDAQPANGAQSAIDARSAIESRPIERRPLDRSRIDIAATTGTTGQGPTLRHPAPAAWPWSSGRYHRPDDGSVAGGGGAPAPVARPPGLAATALARRRRDRGLAGAPVGASRHDLRQVPGPAPPAIAGRVAGRRPRDRRGGGPAPRRRQGHRASDPWERPTRRGRSSLADGSRPP